VLGYKYKRVRLSLKDKRDQAQFDRQQAELEQLKEQHYKGNIDLYYCDESHFGLTPNVCSAWQHKDRPTLLPAAKGRRLSVFGLMNLGGKLSSWVVEGSINSDVAIAMLDEFAVDLPRKTVVVIDNAPIHRSNKFKAKIAYWARRNLLLYFLPPYSPELNLIEILWKHIKYYMLPFDAFTDFQNLKKQLSKTLSILNTKSIINFY
jgi:transposase